MIVVTILVQLSRLLGTKLLDQAGETIGSIEDVVVYLDDDGYPLVTGVLVQVGIDELFVPTNKIESLRKSPIALITEHTHLDPFQRRPGEVLARRDILGREMIHIGTSHKPRLVRAGDIDLTDADGTWRVAGIDVQRRRLPWRRRQRTDSQDHPWFLDWTDLDVFVKHVPTSLLRLRPRRLVQLYPGEIADLVEAASPSDGEEILEALGDNEELEADVFEELDEEHQLEMVAKRSNAEVASLLAHMAPDDAADLLSEIEQDRREPILYGMPAADRQRLQGLLGYNPQTAGGLMIPDGICMPGDSTVGSALERLRREDSSSDAIDTLFLVSPDDVLIGAVRVRELIRAKPTASLIEVGHVDPPRVRTSADLTEIALVMADYNLVTLAVVDESDHVIGAVTVDDVVELLIPKSWRRRAEVNEE